MSTAVIIGALVGGLFILVCIAVTLQGVEKSRKEKRRLENSLNARARNFQYLLDGFPQGFLGRDLQILVCKCLADVYDKLVQADSKNATYKKQRELNAERLKQFQEKADNQQSVTLSDLAQIKEVQKLLSSLHKFIASLMQSKRISEQEAKAYSQQIRSLMTQTTLDGINQQIEAAKKDNKPKLAIHHINTAIDKLSKENGNGQHTARLAHFQQQLAEMQQRLEETQAKSAAVREEADKEWDDLNKPDDSWKKKAIYD